MRVDKASKVKPRRKTVRRVLALVIAAVVVLIVSAVLLAPAFISSEKGRRMILARINDSIAGKADFSDLSMGWLKGVKVADLSFDDDAGRVSVRVGQVSTKPLYGALLTGNLAFGETVIDKPSVEINIEDVQAAKAEIPAGEPPAPEAAHPIVLPVKSIDLVLNNGNVKITDPESGTIELSRINSKVSLQPPGRQTDFDLKMAVWRADKASAIKVAGHVTPNRKTGWGLKGTSGNLRVEVNDLDLESLGPIFTLAGVEVQAKGVVGGSVKGQLKDGRFENLLATVQAENLDVTGAQLKGDRLRIANLDVVTALSQGKEMITVDSLVVKSDFASVAVGGTVPTNLKSAGDLLDAGSGYSLEGTFNCDLAAVAAQMPRTLGLREGTQITGGRLTGNIRTVSSAEKKQVEANVIIDGLEGSLNRKKTALSEPVVAMTVLSSGETGITLDRFDVMAPFAMIKCSGGIESLKYEAGVDLARLQSQLGQFVDIGRYKMAGRFACKGDVSVTQDSITASGSSIVTNLLLDSQDGQRVSEPRADIDFAVNIDRKENIVNIDSAGADASFGRVGITNCVLPLNEKSRQPMRATISASNVDLERLLPVGVMFGSLPRQMQLSGIVNSTVSVECEKDIYKIATDSTRIDGLKLMHPEHEKPFEPNKVALAFEAEIGRDGAINARTLKLESDLIKVHKAKFSRITEGDKTRLTGEAQLEYDWSVVSALAAPYLPEGLTLEGTRKDAITFKSEYPAAQSDQLMPNLSAQARLGFKRAGYMGLDFGSTDVDIRVLNGLLKIAPFSAAVNEGQFNFAGEADFKQKPALFKAAEPMQIVKDIKVNDKTTARLLKYVNPIFANALNVSGIANFHCEQMAIPLKARAKNEAVVIGTISMNKVRLQASDLMGQIIALTGTSAGGTEITIHPTRFFLQNGFLRYGDMQMDIGNNPVKFKGFIGLDKSLDMTVTLPYTTAGRTARVGIATRGRRITLPIKGTVDKPELDMGKLLEEQLKGELEDQLQKALEDLFKK